MVNTVFLFFVVFFSFFVKAITGFGNTLVMGSLLSFTLPNRTITPIDLLFSIPTNAYMVWKDRKNISIKIVMPLSILLLIGIIPGIFLLKAGNEWVLKAILGLVVIGMAIEMLLRKTEQTKKSNPIILLIIGIASGVLAGMYSIGALLVAYISRTTVSKGEFRANICCVFLVDNIVRFFLYCYTGLINIEVIKLTLILIPAVILGMAVGLKIDGKMNEHMVKKFVITLLIISGSVLFLKSVLFH